MLTRRDLLTLLPPALLAQSSEPAWTSLFDGTSLHGWSAQEGPATAFQVTEGTIAGTPASGYPAWLRSGREYENFEFELEWLPRGWSDGGIYFSAPDHGSRARAGFKISLFHQVDKEPRTNSSGAIYPYVAPKLVNVKPRDWNHVRVRLDWPQLDIWYNGEQTHSLNADSHPELRYKLRSGYLGLETLSYPLRFRNLRIRELPSKQKWEWLYHEPSDLEGRWAVTGSNQRAPAKFTPQGGMFRGEGLGNLTSKEKYRDFELQMYIRGQRHHNGGIQFRSEGRDHYEIQLHDVEEAHYPTGSLYHFKRSVYPRVESEQWYFFQLLVKDAWCLVRINGENVMEYDRLERHDPGSIELQAHDAGKWIEYKKIRVRRLAA